MQNKLLALTTTFAVMSLMLTAFALPYASADKGPRTVTQTFPVPATSGPTGFATGTTGVIDTEINLVPGASVKITATGTGIWAGGKYGCYFAATQRGLSISQVCTNYNDPCKTGSDADGVGTSAADGNTCGYIGPVFGTRAFLVPSLTDLV